MTGAGATRPDVSVVIATYNRCDELRGAIESFVNQELRDTTFELIVVDNNSTDETRQTVARFRDEFGHGNLVYCFEQQQGVSFARNCGIMEARASIIAFTDDDIRPQPDWVASVHEAFERFPQADFVGGKVLPDPETKFPVWLTADHWSPLALLDLGDEPLELDVR